MYKINDELNNILQSIEISHCFAKDFNHGINKNEGWGLFEPTKFIYAFFAFNMLYSIDWAKKLALPKEYDGKSISRQNAKGQFKSLVHFIYYHDERIFEESLLKLDKFRGIHLEMKVLKSDLIRSKIKTGKIARNTLENFLIATEKFSNIQQLTKDDHYSMLEMSYAVRNNFFHGEKKASSLKNKGHRNRLLYYGYILTATNESFFEILKNHYNYRRIEDWEVFDNLNIKEY